MALKDDDKKKALAAAAKSSSAKSTPTKSSSAPSSRPMPTMSGKKPATFGGANSKLPVSKTKATSPVMVQPPKPVGRDASGSANFNRTAPSRATITAGPAKFSMGGKTSKSSGGIDYSKGNVLPEKQDNSTAKMSPGTKKPGQPSVPTPKFEYSGVQKTNSVPIAVGAGFLTGGAGVAIKGKEIGKGLKKAAKFIIETPKRIKETRAQNEINRKYEADRKAQQEAKNPSTPVAKGSKVSKSTMKKLKKK